MRFILVCFFILFICTAYYPGQDNVTQLAIARIQYIYKAKRTSGDTAWSSFGSERYNIPLIYYAGNTTFVSNPPVKFIKQFRPELIFENKATKIFKLDFRIDSVPLHMHVSMSFSDTAAYDYYSPFIKCSSREEFETVTGYQTSTRRWASMVLHEFFHGYQTLHKEYVDQAIQGKFIYSVIGDNLHQLYGAYGWFKSYIDTENGLLLRAIQSTRKYETDSLIKAFFEVRDKRRAQTKAATNYDISLLEKSFETHEGTARFIEAFFFEYPVSDSDLKAVDSSFSIEDSPPFKLPEDLFKTEVTQRYFYATGYNITRLLKKLNYDYTTILFKQPSLTVEDILKR